jgi:hypothetical protein
VLTKPWIASTPALHRLGADKTQRVGEHFTTLPGIITAFEPFDQPGGLAVSELMIARRLRHLQLVAALVRSRLFLTSPAQ